MPRAGVSVRQVTQRCPQVKVSKRSGRHRREGGRKRNGKGEVRAIRMYEAIS